MFSRHCAERSHPGENVTIWCAGRSWLLAATESLHATGDQCRSELLLQFKYVIVLTPAARPRSGSSSCRVAWLMNWLGQLTRLHQMWFIHYEWVGKGSHEINPFGSYEPLHDTISHDPYVLSSSFLLPAGVSVPSSILCSHCRTEGATMGVLGGYW